MQVSESYIKQSYGLAWRFFTKNKMASFIVMGAFFVLAFFSMIPLIGFIVTLAMGVLMFSVQVYVAKSITHSENEEEYEKIIQNTKPSELITQYLPVGAGAYLGFFLIEALVVLLLFIMLISLFGAETLTAISEGTIPVEEQLQMYKSLGVFGFLFAVIMMFFAYIYPLVLGSVYRSESFGEAFVNIFLLFSPKIWKASFNGRYFFLITMLHLTIIGAMVLMMISIMSFVLIPVAVFMVYIMTLYFATTAVLGDKVSFEGGVGGE